MTDSILNSVKKLLGITEDYTHFDADIITHINSVFVILSQLGVGSENGFAISDASAVWSDFLPDRSNLELVKSYMYLKVRLLFDPPQSSAVMDAINRSIGEFEFRLNVETESKNES